MFNSKGKGENITVNDIGGENLISTYSKKLLGFQKWTVQIDRQTPSGLPVKSFLSKNQNNWFEKG